MDTYIRVNGRGNAWPLVLGDDNPRHVAHRDKPDEFANTSLSIIGDYDLASGNHRWEVVFDIGQGIVPFLIRQGNRAPDAVVISHPHFDHFSGLDWLVASFERTRQNPQDKLPIYASGLSWEIIRSRFFYLTDQIDWREFKLGCTVTVPETSDTLHLTPFPVYHGPSAPGAILLLAEVSNQQEVRKAVFTGDVLTPLLRNDDYDRLRGATVLFADASTRFPSPSSGHWSLVEYVDGIPGRSKKLCAWLDQIARSGYKDLIKPHQTETSEASADSTLGRFVAELQSGEQRLCCSVMEFVKKLEPTSVELVHYSGYEDKDSLRPVLTDPQLSTWVEAATRDAGSNAKWNIPRPGYHIKLS